MISLEIDLEGYEVEILVKNADYAPLIDGATHGDISEWMYTGQGWGNVL